jgi:tRNA pseudouridine38-40 synthase
LTTRFRLGLEYDGTDFRGWSESDGVRTVAGTLRAIVERITQAAAEEVSGASRTDAGVHALAQCAVVGAETALAAEVFGRALRGLAPPDLGIARCELAPPGFDPRRDAIEKRYLYRIWNGRRSPVLGRRGLWWVAPPLDPDAMASAARSLVGRHDFAAFRNRSKGEPETTVRTVRAVEVRHREDEIWVQAIGEGFLYRMVRNFVGTLVEVGRGALPAAEVAAILAGADRTCAGPSAPPHGLYLAEIVYPGDPPASILETPLRF